MKTVARIWLAMVFTGCAWLSAPADVNVDNDLHGAYDNCIAEFTRVLKRDEVDKLDSNKKRVHVVRGSVAGTTPDNWDQARRVGSNSTLTWNPNPKHKFDDGVEEDGCATLYHEMDHANDQMNGVSKDYAECFVLRGGKKTSVFVSISEINATKAENRYRKARGLGLRTTYNGQPLPQEECLPPPPPPPPKGGCNMSSGGNRGAKTAPCDKPDEANAVPACVVGTWNVSHPWSEAHSRIRLTGVYQVTIRADGSFDEKRNMSGSDPRDGGSTSFSHASYGNLVLARDEKVPGRYRLVKGTHIGRPGARGVIIDNKGRQTDSSAVEQMAANAPWPPGTYFTCRRDDAANPMVDLYALDSQGHSQEWSHFIYSRAR